MQLLTNEVVPVANNTLLVKPVPHFFNRLVSDSFSKQMNLSSVDYNMVASFVDLMLLNLLTNY